MRTHTTTGMYVKLKDVRHVIKLPLNLRKSVSIAYWLKAAQQRSDYSFRHMLPLVIPNMTRNTSEESDISFPLRITAPVVIFFLAIFVCFTYKKCRRRCKEFKERKTAEILVQKDEKQTTSDNIFALQYFIKKEFNLQVNLVTKIRPGRKYLLPCKHQNRIPEEIQRTLRKMGFQGIEPPSSVFIVIMKECVKGKETAYARELENSCLLMKIKRIACVFYEGCLIFNSSFNDKAKEEIRSFFSS
ncbi:uncharacterized protein LOC134250804 [Saccostrea cucullata]|uniref:uncharacterized protein LOC134250804 n=1 Tax=Saccostrea cuccullata TaxID=36930 RepID=UPI002ED12222